MPDLWMVTWDGVPLFKALTRKEAEAKAERWQGERYKSGLLKHGDKRDYIEVKRDTVAERELDERYKTMKAGDPQTITMVERIED